MSQKVETNAVALPGRQSEAVAFEGSLSSTPRRSHIVDAGLRTIARGMFSSRIRVIFREIDLQYRPITRSFILRQPRAMQHSRYGILFLRTRQQRYIPPARPLPRSNAPSRRTYPLGARRTTRRSLHRRIRHSASHISLCRIPLSDARDDGSWNVGWGAVNAVRTRTECTLCG